MDVKDLKGSESLDEFKHWHKTGNKKFWACDIDLVLFDKYPPGVVAILDYKNPANDSALTFATALVYGLFLRLGIPVFIVFAQPPFENDISVYRLIEANWRPNPPVCKYNCILASASASEYWRWENGIRVEYRNKHKGE